jgi:hypothetical protein
MDALAHTDCTQLIKKLQRMPFRWDAERLLFFLSLCITIISAPRTYGTLLGPWVITPRIHHKRKINIYVLLKNTTFYQLILRLAQKANQLEYVCAYKMQPKCTSVLFRKGCEDNLSNASSRMELTNKSLMFGT